jgi:hypothetical protein
MPTPFCALRYKNIGAVRHSLANLLKCLHLTDKQRACPLYLLCVRLDIAEGEHDGRRMSLKDDIE